MTLSPPSLHAMCHRLAILYCWAIRRQVKVSVRATYVGHLRGSAYPSKPGLTLMLCMKLRQLRHWIEIRVALQRIDEAAITMPGILTSWDTWSD